ncbi:putative nitroreductase [Mobilisporobacter senegalensis]|uniref:Putative nitroreductase n=1 Tax=Mobilisporobacter senegalensis TaxID=1329262 RepID=A0A3N1XPP9_9FIRM|nr:nitroreductase family protein [Mobilisporobacter senegalensis]ROR28238.1 putative nitroreductase [Mobilisporobacter senegalensis]
MNLYDAIFVRKSSRNYIMEEIEPRILDNLMNFIKHVSLLDEHFKVSFKILKNLKDTNELPISTNVKAPYYLVIASEEKEDHLLNVGYVIEQISLYLTTKGIGSCILGVSKVKRSQIADLEYPVASIMAFGKTKENIYRESRKARRISEEHLCSYKSEIPNSIKSIIKAARLAPSSMNSQPWRFILYDNRIHVFARKDFLSGRLLKNTREIDIGIMLSHIMLTSEELWLDIVVKKQDNIAEKEFKKNEYITSVLIK